MQLKWHAAETGEDVSTWAVGDGKEQQLTARDNLEDIILYVCVYGGMSLTEDGSNKRRSGRQIE
jgi:NTP pyrophosphatase (non-canonical NTP hydrolase)